MKILDSNYSDVMYRAINLSPISANIKLKSQAKVSPEDGYKTMRDILAWPSEAGDCLSFQLAKF